MHVQAEDELAQEATAARAALDEELSKEVCRELKASAQKHAR